LARGVLFKDRVVSNLTDEMTIINKAIVDPVRWSKIEDA